MHQLASEELRYQFLAYLGEHPEASQRDIAKALGLSVGKVNYCVRALIEKGLLKVHSFKNSRNKAAYVYLLTPQGIEEKINVTYAFLNRKIAEYDNLAKEIERLTLELSPVGERSR